jgi:beta-lactamase class A
LWLEEPQFFVTLEFMSGGLLNHRKLLLLLGILAFFTPASRAQDPKLAAAEQQIEKRIAESRAEVAVAFRTLDGKTEWFYRVDDSFHAASTMKVPVMIELFHQVKEGKLHLSDPVTIHNEFHSIVDGSIYKLDPADDSEVELYKAEGQARTLIQLCELMITVSSNLATNLVIEKLGVENIRTTVHSLNADGVYVLRGVEDGKAYEKGLNNTTTAHGLEVLMTAIADNKAVDADASRQMIEILERQTFNEGIPAGLPPGTKVAHKTGEIPGKVHHDAAIVYAPRPFVLVILTKGFADIKDSSALMADITRLLYQAVE